MINDSWDTEQVCRNNQKSARTSRTHSLLGKAVLLIGNDTAVLHNLVIKLAQKGADVAVLCWRMPLDITRSLQACIHNLGRQLILIEQAENQRFTIEQLIHKVIIDWGHIDIFIDVSASRKPVAQDEMAEEDLQTVWLPSKWQLTQAVLEEMAHS